MTLGGVYNVKTTTAPLFADMIQRKPACKIRSEGLYHSDATIFSNRIAENHNEDHPRIEKCTDSICVLHYLRESREGRKSKGGYSGRGELK